jgi:hypothetical protein
MRSLPKILSLAIILAGCGAAQAADDANFAKTVFANPAPNAKSRACFVRRYDAQHMAQHPKQHVRDIMLLVGREKFEDEPGGLRWQFKLSAHFTDRKGRYESDGDCSTVAPDASGAATRLHCSVACDGGDMSMTPAADSPNATARFGSLRYWKAGSPESAGADDTIGDGDDQLFQMERAELLDCAPLLSKKERQQLLGRKTRSGA